MNNSILLSVSLSSLLLLQACGGGGNGGGGNGGGGHALPPAAQAPEPDKSSPASPPLEPRAIDRSATVRRVLDTVNPIAVGGQLDVQISSDLVGVSGVIITLDNPDGTASTGSVSIAEGSGGAFFPNDATLRKLAVRGVAPGSYVLKFTRTYVDPMTYVWHTKEAAMPIELVAFNLRLAGLVTGGSLDTNGSSRKVPYEHTSSASGTFYAYPLGQPSATCSALSEAQLLAMPNVSVESVEGGKYSVGKGFFLADHFADADTLCAQFVREADAVAEAPYTFNMRYVSLPPTGDLTLDLEADSAQVPKQALGLMSLPTDLLDSTLATFDWIDRRQVFTDGDVLQQSTSNSARIGLQQSGGTWNYTVATPAASDPPFYLATVEGKPPLVFFVAH